MCSKFKSKEKMRDFHDFIYVPTWSIAYIEPVMPYTDDSAMTRALAESLIEKRDLDIIDVARRFAQSYQKEPERGYGPGAASVSMLYWICAYTFRLLSLIRLLTRD